MSLMEIDSPPKTPAVLPPGPPGGTVYERLRHAIVEGEYAPGQRLKVAELAAAYGTSTNPVREALQLLHGEGFVVIDVNRGARVRSIDQAFIRDVYEIVAEMEAYLIRWFASACTRSDLEFLRHTQMQIEELAFKDLSEFARLDTAFHSTMYRGHYNQRAFTIWLNNRSIVKVVGKDSDISIKRQQDIITEHQAILGALTAQDPARASEEARKHAHGAGLQIVERYRRQAAPIPVSRE